jgi:hypothetical protein
MKKQKPSPRFFSALMRGVRLFRRPFSSSPQKPIEGEILSGEAASSAPRKTNPFNSSSLPTGQALNLIVATIMLAVAVKVQRKQKKKKEKKKKVQVAFKAARDRGEAIEREQRYKVCGVFVWGRLKISLWHKRIELLVSSSKLLRLKSWLERLCVLEELSRQRTQRRRSFLKIVLELLGFKTL